MLGNGRLWGPASPLATAVPTSLDPCQVITSAEASQLTGASFGAGKETTLSGNSKMCIYGGNTHNVFEIIVAIAPDVATAKAAEAQTEADAKKNAAQLQQGLNITKMPNFAPGTDAFMLEIKPNALGIQGRGLGVLRGTSYAYFDDLAMPGSVPSAAAMQAEAMTVLSRLP